MWHVSSCSGVATLRTAIHLLLTYLLTSDSQLPLVISSHSLFLPRASSDMLTTRQNVTKLTKCVAYSRVTVSSAT